MNSIPVIGTPVVNSTYWIARQLYSIDYPVDNYVIINNNGRGEITEELDNLSKMKHKFVKKIHVTHMPANLGVSGSWNLIIKCFMNAPYWIITTDDVAFGPGFLKEMSSIAESDPNIGMVHGTPGDYGLGSWDLFLIRDHIIQQFGLFDENLYPAYTEDADYIMRFMHKPIKKVISMESMYYHGLGTKEQYYTHGSQTQKTDPSLKEKMDNANMLNIDYLSEKWGPNWRVCSPNTLPYEAQPKSVSDTRYDLNFVRSKHTGF
jgi:hypothetical protein